MERLLAGWFAEGSSYLTNAWTNQAGAAKTAPPAAADAAAAAAEVAVERLENEGGAAALAERDGRAQTDESAVSAASAASAASHASRASRASHASRGSARFSAKVVNWTRKVLGKGGKPDAAAAGSGASKMTALDVLLATNGMHEAHDIVDPCALRAVSVIGRGGYGKVMLMRSERDGRLVALKEVSKSNLIDKPGAARGVRPVSTKIEHAEMENLVLHTVSAHPFVTTFHGSFQNRDKIFLVLEYAPGGELFQHMQRQGVFSEARTRMYVAEMTSALAYLHECGIVYRDLKPENVLLDAAGHLRLADFGLSIQFNKHGDDNAMRCFSICGTPEYISPELILCATTRKNDRTASYGKTVDWWALGVLMYEMLFRIPPFYSRERKTMLNKILACDLQFPRPSPKLGPVSDAARGFIAALLKYDERDRLGFGNDGSANVMAHPFFDGLDWEALRRCELQPEFVPELRAADDTANFDGTFTKELLRVDPCSACAFNLELTGYAFLPDDFSEAGWFARA